MYHEILRKSATCCEERAHHRREWCKRVGGNQEGLQDYTAPEDEEQERKMLSEAEDVVENARIVMDGSSIVPNKLSLSLSLCLSVSLPPSLKIGREMAIRTVSSLVACFMFRLRWKFTYRELLTD